MHKNCPFCPPVQIERERIVFENEGFIVTPTYGQIPQYGGYVLIIPKRPVICLGALNQNEIDQLSALKAQVEHAIQESYKKPTITFEHGIVGQSVGHAHVHIVPTSVELFSKIQSSFPVFNEVNSLKTLRSIFQKEGSYLFYENSTGCKFVFSASEAPKYYLRTILAQEMGVPNRANWKQIDKYEDKRLWLDTTGRLKPLLK